MEPRLKATTIGSTELITFSLFRTRCIQLINAEVS